MRSKLVVGNWKMHGSLAANSELLKGLLAGIARAGGVDVAVCVPFPYLSQVQAMLAATPLRWGAQNLSEHGSGAYTGEVSAAMLGDFGCRFAIVGHSERRALYGETDAVAAAKFAAAVQAGLTPILCLGETIEQREGNITEQVIAAQLDAVTQTAGMNGFANAVIAYEPVWAIGTGRTATPQQAQEVHAFIRGAQLKAASGKAGEMKILYGGSVKPDNAAALFGQPDIDGGLIGGAALKAADFVAVCRAAG